MKRGNRRLGRQTNSGNASRRKARQPTKPYATTKGQQTRVLAEEAVEKKLGDGGQRRDQAHPAHAVGDMGQTAIRRPHAPSIATILRTKVTAGSRHDGLCRTPHHTARAQGNHQVVPTTGRPTTVQMGEGSSPVPGAHAYLEGADAVGRIAGHISCGWTNQSDTFHRLNYTALPRAEEEGREAGR